jgi:hypothetical protein
MCLRVGTQLHTSIFNTADASLQTWTCSHQRQHTGTDPTRANSSGNKNRRCCWSSLLICQLLACTTIWDCRMCAAHTNSILGGLCVRDSRHRDSMIESCRQHIKFKPNNGKGRPLESRLNKYFNRLKASV